MNGPSPLPENQVLAERFELQSILGRGGFGITYLARDLRREDACVVKELAPLGTARTPGGRIDFGALSHDAAQRLRHQFTTEARLIQRLSAHGVLPVRASFHENNTGYYVTDYVRGALTLESVLKRDGRLDADAVLDFAFQLLETLDAIHQRGMLHRDVKPSNVLIAPNQVAYLIDFGSAREWHSDLTVEHTVQFSPGFAPIEQLSSRARRGPGTDLYGLCATMYTALAGYSPPPATDRAAGAPCRSIGEIRPELEPAIAHAIMAGLELRLEQRPQAVREFRALLEHLPPDPSVVGRLDKADELRVALKAFRFDRRECPACHGLLVAPQPLKRDMCPVCRQGMIRRRKLEERLCPSCRVGMLEDLNHRERLRICPHCHVGTLSGHGLGIGKKAFACNRCAARFDQRGAEVRDLLTDETATWSEFRIRAGRAEQTWRCTACDAQLDAMPDGRWRVVVPKSGVGTHRELFADEWARVAKGLDPGAGNAVCDVCEADFHAEGEALTLLGYRQDPFGIGDRLQGRLLDRETLRWAAAGKLSPKPGLICETCLLEFDGPDQGAYALVESSHDVLRSYLGQCDTLENWHRLSRGLPAKGDEGQLDEMLLEAMEDAYIAGALPFDSRHPEVVWKGKAIRQDPRAEGSLTVDSTSLQFGGLLIKQRLALATVASIQSEESTLVVVLSDGQETRFDISPVDLVAILESGRASVALDARHLAARLRELLRGA